MFKHDYYCEYWDKYQERKYCFIRAKTQDKATEKFYKENPKCLLIKISLN